MNRLKKISLLAAIIIAIATTTVVFESCQNEPSSQEDNQEQASRDFMAELKSSISNIGNTALNTKHRGGRRALSIPDSLNNDTIKNKIFIELPDPGPRFDVDEDDEEWRIAQLNRILAMQNLKELVVYADSIGAELTLEPTEWSEFSVIVSEDEARTSIAPLVVKAKNYLYAKGFTEEEIQQMLIENEADEESLVPFVLNLYEEEQRNASLTYVTPSFNILNFEARADVDWEQVGRCALRAIINPDAVMQFCKEIAGKKLTKTVIKGAFKVVAKRMSGPVTAAFMIYDFADCMGMFD